MSRKRILLLGDINSVHFQKWIISLCDIHELYVFSLDPLLDNTSLSEHRSKFTLCTNKEITTSVSVKLTYLASFFKLRKFYQTCKPDIVHSHYATSYGMLGSLLDPKKLFISIWGTDVFVFPKKSILHKFIFKRILSSADGLFSTSESMKLEVKKYTGSKVTVIPFGIDINKFCNLNLPKSDGEFCVGTIKSLEPVYRIDLLIKGFVIFRRKKNIGKCHIYGKGYLRPDLQQLIDNSGMTEHIILSGWVDNNKVPDVLNTFDVFCAFSERESFGVSVVEASACELPVLVSDADGFKEVVQPNKTGKIITQVTPEAISEALESIYTNPELSRSFGREGRRFVQSKFDWTINVQKQLEFYNSDQG